ncbi:YbjQ family protein [Sinorhizobium meliloti]|uniref:YbjQ family protein n=1 Tax=Rhizobium meliloti TaxID=382 RepID=UPI003D661079
MAYCRECKKEKPNYQVQLGVCDECFNHISKASPSASTPPPTTTPVEWHQVILTTSMDVPNRRIERIVSIVATEAALGINVFRDIANNWRDFLGGRSKSSQNALAEARAACLNELKREAARLGADAVIAVDLDYNEISAAANGIVFVAATGTAVKLALEA